MGLTCSMCTQVSSRTKIHPTPPTPVQSFHDLSSASIDPISSTASHRSISTEHILESGSRTSVASTDSSTAELKQSQSSPKLSKRSLSAGAGKRVLSGSSTRSPDNSRVLSAGNRGDRSRSKSREKSPKEVVNGQSISESKSSKTSKKSSRKSSATSAELPIWVSDVLPLLKRLDATPYDNTSELCETCDLLWTSLSTHSLLGRSGGLGGTKRRGNVLRTVFRLLDHKNPHVLLKVSKIILAVRQSTSFTCLYRVYTWHHIK